MRKGQRPLATLASVAWPRGCVPLRADGARAKGRSLRSRPLLGRAAVSRGVQGGNPPSSPPRAPPRALALFARGGLLMRVHAPRTLPRARRGYGRTGHDGRDDAHAHR